MHKLEIKLKQHTPMIHFQHDQEGATLRASEVKPKLDRFILTRLGNGDYKKGCEEAKSKGWLVGKGDHNAFWTETRANRHAKRYFGKHYNLAWNETGYPTKYLA